MVSNESGRSRHAAGNGGKGSRLYNLNDDPGYNEFAKVAFEMKKVLGVSPIGYNSMDEYMEAVIISTETRALKAFYHESEFGPYKQIAKRELKKRGEF